MSERQVVLDSSAFIAGYEPEDSKGKHYTVPEVVQELRDEITLVRTQAAIDSKRLTVENPRPEFVEKVRNVAAELGESSALSRADISVISLALQLKESGRPVTLLSGDYSVQNMALRLNVKYNALSTLGITKKIVWTLYCPGCHRLYKEAPSGNICPVCGTQLKRKPLKKTEIEKPAQ